MFLSVAPQANVDKNTDATEWKLDSLATKMIQYCNLLQDLTGKTMHSHWVAAT